MIRSGAQKMSKTLGNVVDPFTLINEYSADALRYFLTREIPFGEDGDFTHERFSAVYEGSLAHGLGNLVSRVSAMIKKYFPDGIRRPSADLLTGVPLKRSPGGTLDGHWKDFSGRFELLMEEVQITEAIRELFEFYSMLDGYVQECEPFKLVVRDSETASVVLWNLAYHLLESTRALEPFLPETSARIRRVFDFGSDGRIQVSEQQALFPSAIKKTP